MGFLLDDVVPTRLMVEISLQPGLKAVYKVETLLRHKDANATALIKVLRTGLSQDMLTAAQRLRDTERLMFKVPDLPDNANSSERQQWQPQRTRCTTCINSEAP